MIPDQAIFLALAISVIGQLGYVRDTLRGRNKPNRVTWAIWALVPLMAFFAQLDEGVGVQSLHTFIVGFGPAMIFTASFINKKAYWKLTRFDIGCGVLSLFGVALWLITQEGALAVFFAIAADALAGLPTLKKTWTHPETESWLLFTLGFVSAAITLLTFNQYSFVGVGFAVYILVFCASIVTIGLLRSRHLAAKRVA